MSDNLKYWQYMLVMGRKWIQPFNHLSSQSSHQRFNYESLIKASLPTVNLCISLYKTSTLLGSKMHINLPMWVEVPIMKCISHRSACIEHSQAWQLSRQWTTEMDTALVSMVNKLCVQLAISPARLHPHEMYLTPAHLASVQYSCLQGMWNAENNSYS